MSIWQRTGRALVGVALVAGGLGACELIEPIEENPNQVAVATLPQLFTAVQVSTFFWSESQVARIAVVWMNQMAGNQRQLSSIDRYVFDEAEVSGEWQSVYSEGGLIAIRTAKNLAIETGCRVCLGILKIHEAYRVGSAADVWGDIPYVQATDPDVSAPELTEQLEVYALLQDTLSSAIADLQSGEVGGGALFLRNDLNFLGNTAAWTRIAHTLKARYFMHVAEVEGESAYRNALEQARQGINTPANNWRAIHTSNEQEANVWFQFNRDRSGYIVPGYTIINLMNGGTPTDLSDDDPRLSIYFTPAAQDVFDGQSGFIGSPPGDPPADPGDDASQLNSAEGSPGNIGFDQPIATCAETQFIRAEAALALGDRATAVEAFRAGLRCQEERWNVSLEDRVFSPLEPIVGVTNEELRRAILEQKYIALFLNMEVWADYQRTCLPLPGTFEGREVPGRLFYGQTERQTNPNVPPPSQQPARNDNDPNPCPSQPFEFVAPGATTP